VFQAIITFLGKVNVVDLYGGVLSNWSSLRSSSNSGLTPTQERRKTTGSGFPLIQITILSSICLGVFGYAHTTSTCQGNINDNKLTANVIVQVVVVSMKVCTFKT